MIDSKEGKKLELGDIVTESYRNGYWFGVIEQVEEYCGTVIAIRLLGGDYYFYDFKTKYCTYKSITLYLQKKLTVLGNVIKTPSATHPKMIEYYHLIIQAEHPEANRLKYNTFKIDQDGKYHLVYPLLLH